MAVTPVQPKAPLTSTIVTGGTAAVVFDVGPDGGWITNPFTNTDQGLAVAEELYVDMVGNAQIGGFGTTFRLEPGQTLVIVPGIITQTTVNAPSSGHRFSAMSWNQIGV